MNKRLAIAIATLGLVGAMQLQNEKANEGSDLAKVTNRFQAIVRRLAKSRAPMAPRQTAAGEFAAAVERLEQMQEGQLREEAVQQILADISDRDIAENLRMLAEDQGDGAASLRSGLILRWANSDPAAAAAWAEAQPGRQSELLQIVATTWADADLENARKWVDTLAKGEGKTRAAIALGYEAARTQPLVSLEMMSQFEPGSERDALMVYSASQWASAEPEKAIKWAQSLPVDQLQDSLVVAIAIGAAKTSGVEAATLLAATVKNNAELETAAVAVVQRWAQTEPAAAAAWIEQFPDTPTRQEATENLMTLWVLQDNLAAWKWADQQQGAKKMDALKAYNRAISQTSVIISQGAESGDAPASL